MSKFLYKGTDLRNMVSGGSANNSKYPGINYESGVNTSGDKLGPINYKVAGSDLGNSLPGLFVGPKHANNTGYSSIQEYYEYNEAVPSWANKVGVAATAGGGGGSGGGGHAVSFPGIDARQPGGAGKKGGNGGTAYGDVNVQGLSNLKIRIGRGANYGNGGGEASNPNGNATAPKGGNGGKGGPSGVWGSPNQYLTAGGGNGAKGGIGGSVNGPQSGTKTAATGGEAGNKGSSSGNAANFKTSRFNKNRVWNNPNWSGYDRNAGDGGNGGNGGNNDYSGGKRGYPGVNGQVYIVWKTS